MPEFTFFEVHFHEFNPTNTAPLLGRGGSSSEVTRREERSDAERDDVPVEEAESSGDESGGVGLGPVVAVLALVVAAAVARKLRGGDDELAELEKLETIE